MFTHDRGMKVELGRRTMARMCLRHQNNPADTLWFIWFIVTITAIEKPQILGCHF